MLLTLLQMEGGLRKLLQSWRDEIMSCLAHAEAVIDFGEDEDDCNDQVYARVEHRWVSTAPIYVADMH